MKRIIKIYQIYKEKFPERLPKNIKKGNITKGKLTDPTKININNIPGYKSIPFKKNIYFAYLKINYIVKIYKYRFCKNINW